MLNSIVRLGFILIVSVVAAPVLDPLFQALPPAFVVLVLVFSVVSMLVWAFRGILSLLVGGNAADHVVGSLTADMIKAVLKFPFWLLRVVFTGLRALIR
ncbi:hypothetical protein [uncultured Thiodictyon sp.]|uniref:hypothetical protein n=1 Tax=uncultured Thiodictyon sp. TaxID=1846217 RepID=UPI0025D3D50A|nr:hypothetical protein [uncultured Thiodictyon sp.]